LLPSGYWPCARKALNEEQKSELHAAYGYIEAMSARVRTSGERPRSAEPAIIFNPRVT